ncbi:molybdate ABC transporter substrate-binding protein [Ferrimonas senticii]|uniref:molybdate ABC transporter substrate-binding protein n=1 Tax=Ferrimonas senticii TaxID=394566 RepID=UPI0004804DCF|nr:molybdate ABC transporter substrate-binding protein [Ferrimonas senticii]
MNRLPRLALTAVLLISACSAQAAQLRVAVAANFKHALDQIAADYQQQTGIEVTVSAGGSGALYTQILHGAPYDLFLSADVERPQLLEQGGQGLAGSRLTYATGILAFWSPGQAASEQLLRDWQPRLSIANPRLAPYGLAAQQTLAHLQLPKSPPLVRGANILQAYQYVQSGNASAGLVALSHLKAAKVPSSEYWLVPNEWHQPIEQQGIVLKRSAHPQLACDFLNYVMAADRLLADSGYLVPDGQAQCRL